MNGLQLARQLYFECIQQIIAERLPELKDRYSAGLIGYGSDVLANDDELSREHEWGPRLHIFINKDLHRKYAAKMNNAFNEFLPTSFKGFPTRFKYTDVGAVMTTEQEGFHHIVITTPERFLELTIGFDSVPKIDFDWLLISEQRLLEFTRGEIFADFTGEISRLRENLKYFPDDVWKYKLAFLLESIPWEDDLISLCGYRGDHLSMHINLGKTIERIMKLCFLLNKKYCPLSPKWLHCEFKKLPELADDIESYLYKAFEERDYASKIENVNKVYDIIVKYMSSKGLCNFYTAESRHFKSNVKYNFQISAKEILHKIKGNLKNITINQPVNSIPIGAVDQWINNEDFLLSAEHLTSAKNIYFAKGKHRDQIGDSMI
ncbi:MAG: DUF4037 domain-containing protein [Ignavibacteria bacterium]|jgi:hypothetical protein